MEIAVQSVANNPLLSLLQVQGSVDGSNYETLVAKVDEAKRTGTKKIILDLHECSYLSSAGLIALRRIIDLLEEKSQVDQEEGWAAIRSLHRTDENEKQWSLLLLNPTSRVNQVLELAGFKGFLPTFTDLDSAVAALIEHAR